MQPHSHSGHCDDNGRKLLDTLIRPLDRFIGPFESSKVVFLDSSSPFVQDLAFILCVRAVKMFEGGVLYIDGGNSMNPYAIVRLAKRYRLNRNYALDRIRVARAFTAYQMHTIISEKLPMEIPELNPVMVFIAYLPDLFLDPDLDRQESHELLQQAVAGIRQLTTKHKIFTFISAFSYIRRHGNQSNRADRFSQSHRVVRAILCNGADTVVRMMAVNKVIRVVLPRHGRIMDFVPVPYNQTTLDEFLEPMLGGGRIG